MAWRHNEGNRSRKTPDDQEFLSEAHCFSQAAYRQG
jgi:hypothetical protein